MPRRRAAPDSRPGNTSLLAPLFHTPLLGRGGTAR